MLTVVHAGCREWRREVIDGGGEGVEKGLETRQKNNGVEGSATGKPLLWTADGARRKKREKGEKEKKEDHKSRRRKIKIQTKIKRQKREKKNRIADRHNRQTDRLLALLRSGLQCSTGGCVRNELADGGCVQKQGVGLAGDFHRQPSGKPIDRS